MRLWDLLNRLLSSPRWLIAFCRRVLFSRKRKDDEEALIGSAQVLPKRKALLLGVMGSGIPQQRREGEQSNVAGEPTKEGIIKGPRYDVIDMRQALIGERSRVFFEPSSYLFFASDIYEYNPEDIMVLINDGDREPTEENVVSISSFFA